MDVLLCVTVTSSNTFVCICVCVCVCARVCVFVCIRGHVRVHRMATCRGTHSVNCCLSPDLNRIALVLGTLCCQWDGRRFCRRGACRFACSASNPTFYLSTNVMQLFFCAIHYVIIRRCSLIVIFKTGGVETGGERPWRYVAFESC